MPLRRALVLAVLTSAAFAPLHVAATEPSVESEVFRLINKNRATYLVPHGGLLAVARNHSRDMARRGGLDHNDADQRITYAPPDPPEANGAPDDGTPPASWCENVTYSMGTSQTQAPQRIYDAWEGRGAHGRCMNDTSRNVGAVGVYYDGQSWWATFIATVDNTPPGGAPPPHKPASTADKKPSTPATEAPVVTPAPVQAATPEPVGMFPPIERVATPAPTLAPERTSAPVRASTIDSRPVPIADAKAPAFRAPSSAPAAEQTSAPLGYGWQEVLAVVSVLALASVFLKRSLQRAPEVERRDDVPLTEVEPVSIEPVGVGVERYGHAVRV